MPKGKPWPADGAWAVCIDCNRTGIIVRAGQRYGVNWSHDYEKHKELTDYYLGDCGRHGRTPTVLGAISKGADNE